MNSILKKLYEDARLYEDASGVRYSLPDELADRLGQSIVQECLAICKHATYDDDDQFDLGRAYQAKQTAELIRRHFGVEE